MAWAPTLGTLMGFGAAAISGSLGVLAIRYRSERTAFPFARLMLALAAWSAVYGVQLGFQSPSAQLVVQRVTLGIAGFVPTAWLVFTLRYSQRDSWLDRRLSALLWAEPVAFLLCCVTNPIHGLVWTETTFGPTLGGSVPALVFGPVYVVHIAYAYLIVAVGILVLLRLATHAWMMYRRQVALLVAGALPPFASHVAFTLGTSPIPNLDLTPFLFAFTGVVVGLALFRFKLLSLTPSARVQSLRAMGDGLVVLDDDGTIVDVLGVARDVFEPSLQIGTPIAEVVDSSGLESIDDTIQSAIVDGQRRSVHLKVAPVRDHAESPTGQMIMVRDVTGLRESEQRLEVSNRVLRHNLRNDIGVILGYAQLLEERLGGQEAEYARAIRDTAADLHDLSEKARRMTRLADAPADAANVDVSAEVADLVAEFRSDYPAAQFELDVADGVSLAEGSAETFRIAVTNVLENAVEHNDSARPTVSVSVASTESEVRVDVSDDGPGLPELEQNVIGPDLETPLQHSKGLGLWLTYWCVTAMDGSLEFDTSDAGTTVSIVVPTRTERVRPTT